MRDNNGVYKYAQFICFEQNVVNFYLDIQFTGCYRFSVSYDFKIICARQQKKIV